MTREQYDELSAPLRRVMADMEDEILREIAAQLARDGNLSDTSKWRMRQLARSGKLDKKITEIIASYADVQTGEMRAAIETAALTEIGYLDEGVRDLARKGLFNGTTDIPAEVSAHNAAKAFQKQAKSDLNLVNTVMRYKAKSSYASAVNAVYNEANRQDVLDVMGKGAASAVMGQRSLQEATRKTIKELAHKGIPAFVDKRGHEWSPEAYVMMDMRSTLGNTARAAQDTRCDQYGINLIQVSSHMGARPLCAPYQGRIFSRDGSSGVTTDADGRKIPYVPLSSTSYGQPAGLFGINCGHMEYPFIAGVSFQTYFPYPEEENAERYKQFQRQRAMERQIRDAKRECMMLDETGDKDEFAKASLRLKNKRAQYREYCNETGLRQHNDRTQVYGFDRSVSSKTTWAAKKSQTGGSSSGAVGSVATSVSTSQVDSDLNTVSYVTPETIKETLKGLTSPSGSSIISSKPSIILESRDYKEASVALYDSMQKQHSTITSSPIRKSIAKHQKPDGSNGGYVATRNYSNINQKLRDNEFDLLDADDKQTVESMRTAISKNTLGSDLVLTRYVNADYLKPVFGIDVDYMDMELRPDAKDSNKKRQNIVQSLKDKVDTEFTEKAFVSTSIIKDNNIMTDKSVRLTINAPKETHCYIPKNKRESECILGENSRFYITDIKESDDGKIEIFVTIIN